MEGRAARSSYVILKQSRVESGKGRRAALPPVRDDKMHPKSAILRKVAVTLDSPVDSTKVTEVQGQHNVRSVGHAPQKDGAASAKDPLEKACPNKPLDDASSRTKVHRRTRREKP